MFQKLFGYKRLFTCTVGASLGLFLLIRKTPSPPTKESLSLDELIRKSSRDYGLTSSRVNLEKKDITLSTLKDTMGLYIRPIHDPAPGFLSNYPLVFMHRGEYIIPMFTKEYLEMKDNWYFTLESCGPEGKALQGISATACHLKNQLKLEPYKSLTTNDQFINFLVEKTFRNFEDKYNIQLRDDNYSNVFDMEYESFYFREFVHELTSQNSTKK